jgi:prophage tail gpP-like protein
VVSVQVNGVEYSGWQTGRIVRSIETIAGCFDLSVSERWADRNEPWPIAEEDEIKVLLDGVVVLVGTVDVVELSYTASEHTIQISGRDRTGELVDCSAKLDKWEFLNTPLLTIAKRLCSPYGINVSVQSGLQFPKPETKIAISPGDSSFEVLERACRKAGVLAVSDGKGGLLLTRAGTARTTTKLVEGENILSARSRFDFTDRFYEYVVMGQHSGTDEFSGETAAAVLGSAKDLNVRRTNRKKVVRPDGNVTPEHSKQLAQFHATVSAGRGDTVNATVQGWKQADGSLWPVNVLVPVRSPRIRIDGDLLITQVEFSVSPDSGTLTNFTLRRPDAFTPEPTVSKSKTAAWKELAVGV